MRVNFDQICLNHTSAMTLNYHTADFEKYMCKDEAAFTFKDDGERCLALYLSGKVDYNNCLRE